MKKNCGPLHERRGVDLTSLTRSHFSAMPCTKRFVIGYFSINIKLRSADFVNLKKYEMLDILRFISKKIIHTHINFESPISFPFLSVFYLTSLLESSVLLCFVFLILLICLFPSLGEKCFALFLA